MPLAPKSNRQTHKTATRPVGFASGKNSIAKQFLCIVRRQSFLPTFHYGEVSRKVPFRCVSSRCNFLGHFVNKVKNTSGLVVTIYHYPPLGAPTIDSKWAPHAHGLCV